MTHRITRLVATQVVVPAREGYCDRPAFGETLFDQPSKWMIELFSSEGLVGYGETPRGTGLGDIQWCAKHVLGKALSELSWRRPIPTNWAVDDAMGHANPPVPYRYHEVEWQMTGGAQGLTVAITDLLGKAAGTRAVNLFGGACREWVPTSFWVGRTDPDHAARQTEIGLKLGYNGMKIKGALEDDIVGIVHAIKKVAGPDAPINIDPNMRFYRMSEALMVAKELEGLKNVMIEDPFPYDTHEWALYRQKTTVPLVNHYATTTVRALAERNCDHVTVPAPAGRFLSGAAMAFAFGAQCWASSGVELGIFDAYMLHASAAAQNAVLPGDCLGHDIRVDDLIVEKLEAKDGAMRLPEGPGIGVTLDQAAMKRFEVGRWEAEV